MLANEALKDEEREFGLTEVVAKAIQLPIDDFVTNYSKFSSAIQNARNIRMSIPRRFAKMLVDLASRDIDKVLFARVCEVFYKCLDHTQRNSGRLFAYVLKQLKEIRQPEYLELVCKTALAPLLVDLRSELTKEIPDANKQTVGAIVKKCSLLRRVLYTLNKHKEASRWLTEKHGSVQDLMVPAGDLLLKLQIKEKLALKMLS